MDFFIRTLLTALTFTNNTTKHQNKVKKRLTITIITPCELNCAFQKLCALQGLATMNFIIIVQ